MTEPRQVVSRLEMLYLQLSLDGATAEVNDPIRGKGTYEKIVRPMECLMNLNMNLRKTA